MNLTQGKLNRLFLREVLKIGRVKVHFNIKFVSILENSREGVTVLAHDTKTDEEKRYRATCAVGADGSHSPVRKAPGLPFPGHTWPERLISTNVMLKNEPVPFLTHFTVGRKHWRVCTPLEDPVVGETTLWRWVMAEDPTDNLSDDELISDAYIHKLYERNMPSPRPLQVEIKARTLYKIHQRLAPTLRKGNVLLAGDAAHICNVGLLLYACFTIQRDIVIFCLVSIANHNTADRSTRSHTGILDAEALAEALIMVLDEGRSDAVLDVYSDERRKVFQYFVDPTSTHNKLRLQYVPADTAAQDDWYMRIVANPRPTREQLMGLMKSYFDDWRTDIRKATQDV